jgi:hypothetical protein
MRFILKKFSLGITVAALSVVCLSAATKMAEAGGIPYVVIAPHEYQLPVGDDIPEKGQTLLLSYNFFRDDSQGFKGKDTNGHSSVRNTVATVNKLAHIFKIDGIDNVGFLWEAVAGYANATMKDDNSVSGMLDPQTGLVVWTKPTKNWVTCLEYWMHIPFGDNELSAHSWDHDFTFMTNYVLGNFTFDGDIGYKVRGDYKHGGEHRKQKDTVFANVVFAYKFMNQVEPFVKLDYQSTGNSSDKDTGDIVVHSNNELAYGVGNQFQITKRLSFAAWYEQGITGKNTTKTKAGMFRAIWSF